jgi:hypothetical protein
LDPAGDLHGILFDPDRTDEWIETLLTIPSVEGPIVKFGLFPQQRLMLEEHTGRDVTVKGRQTRASSLILARNLRRMTTGFGLKCLVIAQDDSITALFRERIEHHLRDLAAHGLEYSYRTNKEGIVIGKEMENRFIFASGEQRVAGRAYSAQIVHISELAHWKPESAGRLLGGITPAVPGPPHGWFDIESTPNGAEGEFFDYATEAMEGSDDPLSRWMLHFYPWFLEPRYRAGLAGTENCDLHLSAAEFEQLVDGFTPTPHEEKLLVEYGLKVEQILWRRWRERDLQKTGVPFLQEYVEEAATCFITGEENFFSSLDGIDHLGHYKSQVADPTMRLESLKWRGADISFYGPNLSIWERPDPKHQYVGYLDTAEGGHSRDSDFSALAIVNIATGHNAATLRLKAAPSEVGAMCCAVMAFYNMGTLAGERGSYGSAALERIRDLRYPNVYYHVDYNKRQNEPEAWIFPTAQHRDEILRVFREAVFERTFLTRDKICVGEMGTFSWYKKRTGEMKAKAKRRRHDDLVIANAGATFVAQRMRRFYPSRATKGPETVVVGQGGIVMSREAPGTRQPLGFLS